VGGANSLPKYEDTAWYGLIMTDDTDNSAVFQIMENEKSDADVISV
jgi:hypothetical protein